MISGEDLSNSIHLSDVDHNEEPGNQLLQSSFVPGDIAGVVPPLIGRDRELQQLLEQLYQVIESGDSRLVTIIGMAGIGKSRLAYEFRNWIARLPETIQFHTIQTEPQVHLRPYSLIRSIVTSFFRIRESDPPARIQMRLEQGIGRLLGEQSVEKAHFIGHLLGFNFAHSPYLGGLIHDSRQIRERAMHYMLQCIAALADRNPMVLLVDDLQHADDSSLDVLEYLARAGLGVPLLLCGLSRRRLYDQRPEWGKIEERSLRIELQPLDDRDSRRLVGEILRKAGKLSSELRTLIIGRAEGNPLYVEELIKMLIADQIIIPGPDLWQVRPGRLSRLRVPSSLRDLLQSRIQTLSPREREVIERAAVVGRAFWVDALLWLDGLDQAAVGERGGASLVMVDTLLDSLQQKELIVRQPVARFAGEQEYLFRHALLHEVVYERVAPELRRSYHGRTAEWLISREGADLEAYGGLIAEHYEQAGDTKQAAIWYERAARRARAAYALEESVKFYRKAMSFLPDTIEAAPRRIVLYAGLGEMYHAVARLADAALSFNNMRELAEIIGDRAAEARAWNDLASVYDSNVEHRAALECAQQAVELARQAGDQRILGLALVRWGWQLIRLDDAATALDLGIQARVIFEELDDPFNVARTIAMLGVVYELLGRYTEAAACLEQSMAIHRERGEWLEISIDMNNRGVLANARGDWQSAVAILEEDLKLVRDIGNRVGEIFALSNLGIARSGLGDYEQAEEDVRQGIQICKSNRIPIFSDFYRSLAEICLATDRIDEALEAAQQALDLARKSENRREQGAAWRVLGMIISRLDDPLGASPCFSESVRLFAEAGADNERARTLREWAHHERRVGNHERAAKLLSEAQTIFSRLGLDLDLQRLAYELA